MNKSLSGKPGAVQGGAGQVAVSRLLLHPDVRIKEQTLNSVTVANGDIGVVVTSEAPIRVVKSKWWPDFGQELETLALSFEYGLAPGRWSYELRIGSVCGGQGGRHPLGAE